MTRAKYVDWIEQQWGVRIDKTITVLEVELALKEFMLNYQYRTILSDAILIQKVKLLAAELGVPERTLQFSSSWLQKFKECNELDRTLATHRIAGRKVDREHISVALCANADGLHKLNLLIIGKYQKPRCFKNINIKNMPFMYRNNTKAWMITTFFQDWLKEFDCQVGLKHDSQHALLLLDKCSNAGIIISFKRHYRYHYILWMLQQIEAGNHAEDLKMDVLQAIRCAKTIFIDSEIDELAVLIENLYFSDPMQVEEFLSIPEENFVYEVPDDDYIISEIVKIFLKNKEDLDETEEMDNSSEIPIVSADLALESLETVYMYLLQQDNTSEQLKLVDKVKKVIKEKKVGAIKQSQIDQYFKQNDKTSIDEDQLSSDVYNPEYYC
ncbi:17712_t:CDS:2 [Dentiscutata erythropus]|uniref:17712_t:CDS:1 n=1 Tax=Dentiscutata erythropus TaxID=1348616 RepID=A0A9N9EWF3_9GLOM|nr:17712_t:CDS:2 [Dentiscutata erythropus]